MPPSAVVTQKSVEDFQRQYGTLWHAVETYLDGGMPVEQARSLELVAPVGFIGAVASTRLYGALVAHDIERGSAAR